MKYEEVETISIKFNRITSKQRLDSIDESLSSKVKLWIFEFSSDKPAGEETSIQIEFLNCTKECNQDFAY